MSKTITAKALTYKGMFVDRMRLKEGVFEDIVPELYRITDNMNDIIVHTKHTFRPFLEAPEIIKYISNLKRCKLSKVEIKIID